MTIKQWLQNATQKLHNADIRTAQLDVQILLADALQKDRSWLHAHSNDNLTDYFTRTVLAQLESEVERRAKHEPIAYIRGKQEFYGREFYVSPDTLTPRPETETMIELVLDHIGDWGLGTAEELQIIDVGTGSGCIIVTAALELFKIQALRSNIQYVGLDISKPALKIARKNAGKFKVHIDFKEFDLLQDELPQLPNPNSQLLILANLPYVPENFKINLAASHEPPFAIYGGKDGLEYYRALFKQLQGHKCIILTESLPPQQSELQKIAKRTGFMFQKTQDFIQVFQSAATR